MSQWYLQGTLRKSEAHCSRAQKWPHQLCSLTQTECVSFRSCWSLHQWEHPLLLPRWMFLNCLSATKRLGLVPKDSQYFLKGEQKSSARCQRPEANTNRSLFTAKTSLAHFHCLKSLSMLHEVTMENNSQRIKVCSNTLLCLKAQHCKKGQYPSKNCSPSNTKTHILLPHSCGVIHNLPPLKGSGNLHQSQNLWNGPSHVVAEIQLRAQSHG